MEIYRQLLERVEKGEAILTAGEIHPDIPTIHDVGTREGQRLRCTKEVDHYGFGLFMGGTPSGKFSFDAGGAMRSVEDQQGKYLFAWTPLRGDAEVLAELGYDLHKVRAALLELVGKYTCVLSE